MSDHDVEALAHQIEALKIQLENIKRGLWAMTVIFLIPGMGGLIYLGSQVERIDTTENVAQENRLALGGQGRLAAGQAAQLDAIAESLRRVERLLERETQGRN